MRAAVIIAILAGTLAAARGEEETRPAKPARAAEIKTRARGGQAVWLDGRLLWPEADARLAPEITTSLVWSAKGDAVAFVARERTGQASLVVVLVPEDDPPAALTWVIPASALPAKAVSWLGPTRVAVGPTELAPKVIASWRTSR
jgi:hypothetical protein